jgi:AraC family transcriptional regulator of adaptative response / DNA-3-methyladenine glycosylase II
VFFVGITTTRIYCRPICPARVSCHDHRRFFRSAAAAERAGFRPCLRCRPELAPGRAAVDAVPRLAQAAAQHIAAGALNGRSVADLARELGVSERHLRRALEREAGVSPLELAQTHRLLLAKRLLADTALPVTQVAYASGFQSLRRFNAAFRARYRTPPSVVRRAPGTPSGRSLGGTFGAALGASPLRLTLAYRAPLAWDALLDVLARDAVYGVDLVDGRRYARTVRVGAHVGVVVLEHDAERRAHVVAQVSASLVPALMPLLARLRRLLDLDAEPTAIDAHLTQGGLGALVARRPGLRLPGAVDGFDVAVRAILGRRAAAVVAALGECVGSGVPALDRLPATASAVAAAGVAGLEALGVPPRRAAALATVAARVTDGTIRLEPGSAASAACRGLAECPGVGARTATAVVMRALDWPDAFCASERALWRAAGVAGAPALLARAAAWRPWRAYAALHLRLARADRA